MNITKNHLEKNWLRQASRKVIDFTFRVASWPTTKKETSSIQVQPSEASQIMIAMDGSKIAKYAFPIAAIALPKWLVFVFGRLRFFYQTF